MKLDFMDETGKLTEEETQGMQKLLMFTSQYLNLPQAVECSVSIVDNDRIQTINRDFRKIDRPTDVISFALNDHEDLLLPELTNQLGDIIISLDKAQEQAETYQHSLQRELGFLAVHGFLHLNGYDHMTKEEEEEMFGLQRDILQAYGLLRTK